MDDRVDLHAALASLGEAYDPRIVGTFNDCKILVVKTQGEFVWHAHADTDDFFLCLAGRLVIQLRDRDVVLGPGDLYVVPAGVEHCPRAEPEAHVLLIERQGTPNTGDSTARPPAPEVAL